MVLEPKIYMLGDRGIVVEFEAEIGPKTLQKVLFFKQKIENYFIKEKVEVSNTYNSLLISYVFTIEDAYSKFLTIKSMIADTNISKYSEYQIFEIPVCYDEEFGPDLALISEQNSLEISEIIRLHSAPEYLVYFTGFLPGFLYLGGLDKKLFISRKDTPRRIVEKGSVGIGEKQTGIYPTNSPGGWQILGRSPLNFFDKNEDIPSPFSAGDKIKFNPISKAEFYEIKEQVNLGIYELKSEYRHG